MGFIVEWLNNIEKTYGVNPYIFGVIYLAGILPFWFSIFKVIKSLKEGNKNKAMFWGIILGIIIILPFGYVLIFGKNIPLYIWVVFGLVIVFSVFSTISRIRKGKK